MYLPQQCSAKCANVYLVCCPIHFPQSASTIKPSPVSTELVMFFYVHRSFHFLFFCCLRIWNPIQKPGYDSGNSTQYEQPPELYIYIYIYIYILYRQNSTLNSVVRLAHTCPTITIRVHLQSFLDHVPLFTHC